MYAFTRMRAQASGLTARNGPRGTAASPGAGLAVAPDVRPGILSDVGAVYPQAPEASTFAGNSNDPMDPEQTSNTGSNKADPGRFASLGAALAVIALHVSSYVPLAMFGIAYHRDPLVSAVTGVLSAIWMTIPLACIYGAALGFRSAQRNGWSAIEAVGVLLNCAYSLVGVFFWLLVALNVRV